MEIRLQIYGHLFNIPGNFFELWAPREWTKSGRWDRKDDWDRWGWAKNTSRQIARQKQGLRMMRLCKKIRAEVADYFYGGNNFRFSNHSGIVVMAAFFHTIRPEHCSFLRHITLQIPNRQIGCSDQTVQSNTAWFNFDYVLTCRGMRVPRFNFRAKHKEQGRSEGEFCYDKSVYRCFRQLREMPNLRRLEIIIPWDYKLIGHNYSRHRDWDEVEEEDPAFCLCPAEEIEAMSPEDRIWHTVRDHSRDVQYWDLLADLKENTASGDLAIALVIHYNSSGRPLPHLADWPYSSSQVRQARWIAAYAALMGYEVGHARWETKGPGRGTYQVRYDEDPTIGKIREGQENLLCEPPKLTKRQEEYPLPEPTEPTEPTD